MASTTNKNFELRRIDRSGDVIEIRFGDVARAGDNTWIPIALLETPRNGTVGVELLLPKDAEGYETILALLFKELNFYFGTKQERDPWAYARYHCTTAANIYSSLHWSYFPHGYQ